MPKGNFPDNLTEVVAYGISFPGQKNKIGNKINSVTCRVNKIWLQNNFNQEYDEDDEDE